MPNGIDNGLDNRSVRILHSILADSRITQKKLATETGMSVRTVARELKALRDTGKIKRVGSDRSGFWEIIS